MVKRAALALVSIVPILFVTRAAVGQDVEDITVHEAETVTKNYAPILANEPPVSSVFGTTARVPSQCRNAPYCDAADLTIETPPSYQSGEFFFRVDITLSWPATAPNDLNMYLHRPEPDEYRTHTAATANNPEKISVADPRAKKLVIVVSNFSGPNGGYTLSVAFVPLGRSKFADQKEDPSGPPGRQTTSRSPALAFETPPVVSQPDLGTVASADGQRPVEKPGADGPSSPMILLTLPASRSVPGNSNLPFMITAFVAALALVAFGIVLYRRGRLESEL